MPNQHWHRVCDAGPTLKDRCFSVCVGWVTSQPNAVAETFVRLTLVHRPRRRTNVTPTLCQRLMFAGCWLVVSGQSVHQPVVASGQLPVIETPAQLTQNICIAFGQCWTNVEDVGPTLYKCYTHVLCLQGVAVQFTRDPMWTMTAWCEGKVSTLTSGCEHVAMWCEGQVSKLTSGCEQWPCGVREKSACWLLWRMIEWCEGQVSMLTSVKNDRMVWGTSQHADVCEQ